VEFELKTGSQGHVYLPKKIRKILGRDFRLLPNANAAVVYAETTDPETVIRSLQVIIADLRARTQEKRIKK
jgi:hypothetical protein